MNRGLYSKYVIEKADGSPVDSSAIYFVLRLDTDHAGRVAVLAYADVISQANPTLATDLRWLIGNLSSRGVVTEYPNKEVQCVHE